VSGTKQQLLFDTHTLEAQPGMDEIVQHVLLELQALLDELSPQTNLPKGN
jgi:hypothetical protein